MDEELWVDIRKWSYNKHFVCIWILIFIRICCGLGITDNVSCPSMCVCEGTREIGLDVDCTGKNLTDVPEDLDPNTIRL